MKRPWVRLTLFCTIALMLAVYLGRVLSIRQMTYVNTACTTLTVTGFDTEPRNSLDVLSLGPSTSYTMYLPKIIWDTQGIPVYSLATGFQDARTGYYLLDYALRRQQPKVLMINPSFLFLEIGSSYQDPIVMMILGAMRPSAAKLRMLLDYAGNSRTFSAAEFFLPVLYYHERIRELKLEDLTLRDYFMPHPLKGVMVFTHRNQSEVGLQFLPESEEDIQIDPTGLSYTKKILDLCDKHGIRPVFVAPPKLGIWTRAHHDLTAAFCAENGVAFLDYNEKEILAQTGFDPLTDYTDQAVHVNFYGQQKISVHLGRYLAETFALPDRRGDKAYAAWNALELPDIPEE